MIYIYIWSPPHDPIVCFIHQKTLENTVFLLHTLLQKCDPKILKHVIDKTYRKPKKKIKTNIPTGDPKTTKKKERPIGDPKVKGQETDDCVFFVFLVFWLLETPKPKKKKK